MRRANISIVSSFPKSQNLTLNENNEKLEQFWRSTNRLVEKTSDHLTPIGNHIEEIAFYLEKGSSKCYQVVEYAFRNGFHEEWSAKMLSSSSLLSAHPLANIITENYQSPGSAPSCLAVTDIQISELGNFTFDGMFCLMKLSKPALNEAPLANETNNKQSYFEKVSQNWLREGSRDLVYTICVPSLCEVEEVKLLLGKYFEPYLEGINLDVGYCRTANVAIQENQVPFTISKCLLLAIIAVNLLLTSSSAILKSFLPSNSLLLNFGFNLSNCFHVLDNAKHLLCIDKTQSAKTLTTDSGKSHLHGIQSILIALIIYHSSCSQGQDSSSLQMFLLVALFVQSAFVQTHRLLVIPKLPHFAAYLCRHWFNCAILLYSAVLLTAFTSHFEANPFPNWHSADCFTLWPTHFLLVHHFWPLPCFPNLWIFSALFHCHVVGYLVAVIDLKTKKHFAYLTLSSICLAILLYEIASPNSLEQAIYVASYCIGVTLALAITQMKPFELTSNVSNVCLVLTMLSMAAFQSTTHQRQLWPVQFVLQNVAILALLTILTLSPSTFWLKRCLSFDCWLTFSRLMYPMLAVLALLVRLNQSGNAFQGKLSSFNTFQLFCILYLQSLLLASTIYLLLQRPTTRLFQQFPKRRQPLTSETRFATAEELRQFEALYRNGVSLSVIA